MEKGSEDAEIRSSLLERSGGRNNLHDMSLGCQLFKSIDLCLLSLHFLSKEQDMWN